jgi:DNA-binding transcriptional ArsR family regulator
MYCYTIHAYGKTIQMNALEQLFCSRTRAVLMASLFGVTAQRRHLRALVRETGVSLGTIQQDLRKLVAMGLVHAERDGNRLYYSANRQHPLHAALRELVLRTIGVYGVLQENLSTEDIQYAYVFGSIASGKAQATSDIDLMVLGTVGLRKLASRLSAVSAKLGREINPHVMTMEEYLQRCRSGDHFVGSVIQTQRRMLVGDADELGRLEKQRLA